MLPLETAATVPHPSHRGGRWRRSGHRAAFWTLSAGGVVVMIAAWIWFGMGMFEEMTEQPKALAAGSTMAGFGMVFGGVPLILAHVAGLVILGVVAVEGRRHWSGVVYAIVAVAIASVVGIVVVQLVWGGDLFEMGAEALFPSAHLLTSA